MNRRSNNNKNRMSGINHNRSEEEEEDGNNTSNQITSINSARMPISSKLRAKARANLKGVSSSPFFNDGFASCKTVIQIRSMTTFVFFISCLWMFVWIMYSNVSVHYPLESSSSFPAKQAALDHFENGAPGAPDGVTDGDVISSTTKLTETKTTTTTTTVIENITDKDRMKDRMKSSDNIPIFYNLFVNNQQDAPRVRKIVDEQFRKLLPVHHPIYINSIGTPLDLNETGAILLGHHETAAEHVTLKALYDYCQKPDHVHKKVVYMHSKGSFTATQQNGKLRRFLTSGVLSEECATMPDTCNMCSSRFSPVPHPHTSGNMWLAKCDYVKKLIDPEKFEEAMDGLSYEGGNEFLACDGRGRYSAEHWVHSHPSVKPCDLYSDPKFTWNYDGIPVVKEFKKNLKLEHAPRFDLKIYLKTNIRDCARRGASIKFRIDEYKGLYNLEPTSDWWGYNFLQEKDDWWPHRDYGWVQLPEEARVELIKLGYSHHLWETRHRPYQLYGKNWIELKGAQRKVLARVFTYDETTWNKEVKKENRDRRRIRTAVHEDKPNTSFDRCEKRDGPNAVVPTPWYKKTEEEQKSGKTLREYVYEAPEKPANKKRLLIIASVPRDEAHLITLWSELECFTDHVDHIIVSAPTWAKPYVERVIALAQKYIPHFANEKVSIEMKYFLNNRYDVGLWCDAYNSLNNGKNPGTYDEYGLINDSIFALRKFSGIFDNLEHQNVHMTSLAYSYTYKWNKGYGPEEFWVESVYRGFDNKGMDIFSEHSCVAEDHPFFCPGEDDQKSCIINNFEHDLAKEYPCDKVQGLYPADSPDSLLTRFDWKRTWIKNTRYWRMLADDMGFPIAKANEPEQTGTWWQLRESKVAWKHDPMLKNCTKFFPMEEIFDGLNFKMAKPFHKRKWNNLPPDMQILARDTLGFDENKWDRAQDSPVLVGKSWNSLSLAEQNALLTLECSKLHYNQNDCRVQNPLGPNDNEIISVSNKEDRDVKKK